VDVTNSMVLAFDPREGSYLPCAVAGLATAALVLRADLRRRKIPSNPYLITGIAGVAALAAWILLRETGFAGLAALAAWSGATALCAPYEKVAVFEVLDAGSPAAAAAIAAVNLVLFLTIETAVSITASGTIQLMPLYECLVWAAIAGFLWRMSARASLGPRPKGEIFAIFLMLFGIISFITLAVPAHSFALAGLSPAQLACIGTFAVGGILLGFVLSRYHGVTKEHRILEHTATRGNVVQPEYRKPTPECPHPERWRMYDSMTAEVEVLEFLKTLVTTVKPELVVETGTFLGISTLHIAEGLKENGIGRVVTCELDAKVYEEARKRFAASGLDAWIELRNESSLEIQIDDRIDLLYCDSDMPLREQEVRRFLPQMNPNGLIVLHDASSDLKIVREGALKLEREGLLSVVFLPTPRGLVVAQKREGRA
jgi:predicted O-methyltransferase YrrM